ncbi:hypothetical protein [Pseudomonas viridiflava]
MLSPFLAERAAGSIGLSGMDSTQASFEAKVGNCLHKPGTLGFYENRHLKGNKKRPETGRFFCITKTYARFGVFNGLKK